jgi:hypothetical protein
MRPTSGTPFNNSPQHSSFKRVSFLFCIVQLRRLLTDVQYSTSSSFVWLHRLTLFPVASDCKRATARYPATLRPRAAFRAYRGYRNSGRATAWPQSSSACLVRQWLRPGQTPISNTYFGLTSCFLLSPARRLAIRMLLVLRVFEPQKSSSRHLPSTSCSA